MSRFGNHDFDAEIEEMFGATPEGKMESTEAAEQESRPLSGSGWGPLHETILDSLLDGEEDWESAAIKTLAKSLRVETAELEEILDTADAKKLQIRRLEKLLERQEMTRLGYNWSNLEAAVLKKLGNLVAANRIASAGDLLAVAKAANSAVRRGSAVGVPQMTDKPNPPSGVNIHLNQLNQGLPGAGSLGTISLTLSQRTIGQLNRSKIIDGESERLADKIEMLGPEDVPEISKLVDESDG